MSGTITLEKGKWHHSNSRKNDVTPYEIEVIIPTLNHSY
jgi:hypothetical protein